MDEHAVDLVVAADALTPGNALLDADGVRSLVVSAGHFVHVVVNKTERGRVHDCGDVDAILLEGLEQVRELRPAGDALEHDAVLLGEGQRGGAFLNVLLQVLGQEFEGVGSSFLAAGSDDVGHVVKQVEAAHRGGLVLQEVTDLQPVLRGAVRVLAGKLELLLVKLLAGELLELMDGIVELGADVLDSGIADFHGVVVGDIDHDEGDVAHTGDILVPLGHAVADVVAAEDEVRLGNAHLLVGLDGLAAEVLVGDLLLGGLGQSLDLVDIVQNGVGNLRLGVLLGLTGLRIDNDLAVFVLEGLAAVGVDDELERFGVELAAGALTGGIGQRNTGVTADIVVEAEILGSLAHDLTVALGGDTGSLVLGVHHVEVKGLSKLTGELGAGPTDQLTLLLRFTGVGIDVIDDLAQSKHAGADLFSHD